MIDKIELRLPPQTDFSPRVTAQLRKFGAARPSQHYSGVLDLRPHGFDAILHYRKRRDDHTHKLELFETGKKTHSELASLIESVAEIDSGPLELTRIDLCADIPDVPVSWFHAHARFKYKRIERRVGKLKWDVICRTEIETVTAGARPNVSRIYNKIAQELGEFRKDCKKQSRDADSLEFEQEYGHKKTDMLTRIERQYGGGRLPKSLRTFGMIGNAAEVDPFDTIELISNQVGIVPREEDYEFGEWLKGMRLHDEAKVRGMQNFRRWLNSRSKGNGSRMMKRYAAFMPSSDTYTLEKADILRIYCESTIRQLAA